MVETVVREMGGIDILINNAGMYPRVSMLDMRESDWDYVLDINLRGSFFCAQAAARAMIAAKRGIHRQLGVVRGGGGHTRCPLLGQQGRRRDNDARNGTGAGSASDSRQCDRPRPDRYRSASLWQ